MDVCKCVGPLQHEGTLNSRRAASPLVRLVEGEESYTRAFGNGHVILIHGQVTWTTPELAPPSPNYHTTPISKEYSLKSTLPRYMAARVL
ncbi:hypothetical protein TNCV_755811 [Trichonephila clavipes]|nr:hypothetical protein TNCV_755811 [Trichonephila clavipes]